MQHLREKEPLKRPPGLSETLDWARSIEILNIMEFSSSNLDEIKTTLPILLKEEDDVKKVKESE